MGLIRSWVGGHRMDEPVPGTARVTAASPLLDRTATWQNCAMTLLVEAPGLEPVSVDHEASVRVDRWPAPGDRLAVTVDLTHPERLTIDWERAREERHAADADKIAAIEAGRNPTPGGPDLTPEQSAAVLEQLRRMGVDPDAVKRRGGR